MRINSGFSKLVGNKGYSQVKEVYGGDGKVKVKKKNKNKVFSFKYTGPERAAKLLEGDTSSHSWEMQNLQLS